MPRPEATTREIGRGVVARETADSYARIEPMGPGHDHDPTSAILSVSSWRDENRAVVELTGELDLDGSGRLTDEVHRVLSDPIDTVEIQARHLRFIDSSGLVAVLRARSEAHDSGVSLHLSEVSPEVSHVIDMAGLTNLLQVR